MAELWIAPQAAAVLQALERAGIDAWIVGGCVRDMLRGVQPHDWDITAAAIPEEIEAALCGFRLIETGIRHGTVTALSDGEPIEVTACRGEGDYMDMRHPSSVTFHRSIEEDLARRDFTINALAYSPKTGLLDLWGGEADLHRGILRCIRDPGERFSEDALRILRALRFSAVLGFEIERETAAAVHRLAENICHVSIERCTAELTKLLTGENAGPVLEQYGDVPAVLLPELARTLSTPAGRAHWRSGIEALSLAPQRLEVRLALFLMACRSIVEQETRETQASAVEETLRALHLPGQVISHTVALIRFHDALPTAERASVLHGLHDLGPERLLDLTDLREAECRALGEDVSVFPAVRDKIEELTACGACCQLSQLALSGNDLKAMGYSGRAVGMALNSLLEAVMDGKCENTPEGLRSFLRGPDQIP